MQLMAHGWAGNVKTFLELSEDALLTELTQGFVSMTGQFPSAQQTQAWEGTWRVLSASLAEVVQATSDANTWGVVLEYELPLEGGRRPDVVLLAGNTVVVLEFKEKAGVHAADLDQTSALRPRPSPLPCSNARTPGALGTASDTVGEGA